MTKAIGLKKTKRYTAIKAILKQMVPFLVPIWALATIPLLFQFQTLRSLEKVAEHISLVLLFYMAFLVIRYVLFLGLSYLHNFNCEPARRRLYRTRISVLVPAYNEAKVIEQSIASLLQLDYPYYEIIVIDDGSSDDTYERAKKWEGDYGKTQVHVFRKSQGGKASALNFGIRAATGELVLCMDGDSKLAPQTLKVMARHFQDGKVGAVAGRVKVANMDRLLTKLQELEYIQGLNFYRRAQGYLTVVDTVPGPCGAFRKKALLEVGGYDSDTFAEDCDITLKILSKGWKVLYEPAAISVTEAPEGILNLIKQRYRWTRGKLQSLYKHRSSFGCVKSDPLRFFIFWHLMFETVVSPFINTLMNLYLLAIGWTYGFTTLLFLWWVQWTLLDIATTLYCVSMDGDNLRLVPLAFFYRIGYIFLLDICKVFATMEQFFGLKMDWGKLERKGKLEM